MDWKVVKSCGVIRMKFGGNNFVDVWTPLISSVMYRVDHTNIASLEITTG